MPRIDTVQSSGQTPAFRAPNVRANDLSALGGFGESVNRFGGELAQISDKLRMQQDEIDAAGAIGQYNSTIKELAVEVDSQVPDPNDRPAEYAKRLDQKVADITSSIKGGGARASFQRYVARNRPVNVTDFHMTAVQAGIQRQNAALDELGKQYSKAATLAPTPEQRDDLIKEYLGLLDKAEGNLLRNPVQTQKAKEAFKEQAQVDFMAHLRSTDPDRLFELETQGAFNDVPVTKRDVILDRATREKAAREARGQAAFDKAMVVWRESIERETEKRIANNDLTPEWLEEYEYALSSEKVRSYRKALHDQREGISGGDPDVERSVHGQVYDRRTDPRTTLDRIVSLYGDGKINKQNYATWSTYLRSEIDRADNKAQARQDKAETDVKQLQGRRHQEAESQLALAFKATGLMETFDNAAAEALAQGHEELARRSVYLGEGNEDPLLAVRDMVPRLVAQVETRASSRLQFLESQLGSIRTRADLRAAKSGMSEAQFERSVTHLEEYVNIQKELARLNGLRRAAQDKQQPAKAPAGRWQR